ncbi:glycosyltransferase [Aureivirga marina]|uniref:glycosyltransferase n=1 Tax=Aureivirga marina TaxID=1182451 RepID=UPI0018C9C61A|nr:glycosyltransferase [Aureivirga marina]
MKSKKLQLNIISFDVPYPANYGGVIDVFYKLKALSEIGVEIFLHTFEYGRGQQKELEKYCKKVFYYPRNNSLSKLISRKPFLIQSRYSDDLIKNIKTNEAPILFEGLHTTAPLLEHFSDRITLIRAHNIEHNYYNGLYKSETNKLKKYFFLLESFRLKNYEDILSKTDYVLSISPFEHNYFNQKFNSVRYIPVFHKHNQMKYKGCSEKFALYHGDLRVADNKRAAQFAIDIFSKIKYPLKIVSSHQNKKLMELADKYENISFIQIKTQQELDDYIQSAHINILPTFQKTGIKLKLINVLFSGRFAIVNDEMISDTGLESLCHIANSKEEFRKKVMELAKKEFTEEEFKQRQEGLRVFNTQQNALQIKELIVSKKNKSVLS